MESCFFSYNRSIDLIVLLLSVFSIVIFFYKVDMILSLFVTFLQSTNEEHGLMHICKKLDAFVYRCVVSKVIISYSRWSAIYLHHLPYNMYIIRTSFKRQSLVANLTGLKVTTLGLMHNIKNKCNLSIHNWMHKVSKLTLVACENMGTS